VTLFLHLQVFKLVNGENGKNRGKQVKISANTWFLVAESGRAVMVARNGGEIADGSSSIG